MEKRTFMIMTACAVLVCAAFVLLFALIIPAGTTYAPLAAYASAVDEEGYTVSSAEEWNDLAARVQAGEDFFGKTVTLTSDIDGDILPLGDKDSPFCGILEGGGHIVFADIAGGDYSSPVGYLSLGTVRRLGVHGDMNGEQAVGGVVGFNDRGKVEECYHFGVVSADNYAGGIVGENRGEIYDCYHIGSVRTQGENRFAGGICATNDYDGSVSNCYAVSDVESTGRGGIVGYAGRGRAENCYYIESKCDRGYSQAGNAVLDIRAITSEELTRTDISDAFSLFTQGGEDWGAYPDLSALNSPLNAYVNWADHLLTADLLVLVDGADISVGARTGSLPSPDRRGYTFEGWFTASEGGEEVTDLSGSGDICLYSRFSPITYNITFNLGEGAFAEGFSPVLTYTVESGAALPGEEDIELAGMTFGGWVNEEGEEVADIPVGSIGDITLTARYTSAAITVITDIGGRYFWVIVDVALLIVLLIEAAVIGRAIKKRSVPVFAFAPFSSGMFFYPLGFIIACAEAAIILLMPLLLLKKRHVAAIAAAQAEMEEEFIASPKRPLLLTMREPLEGVEEINSRMHFRNSFTARLAMSSESAKELYRSFKIYALSYERVKSRISWGGETFYSGKHPLARLSVTGNTLRIYFALEPNEVDARYRAEDKGSVKKYSLTPVMIKVRSARAEKRARRLFDLTAEKFSLTRGMLSDTVLDNEEVLQGKIPTREELIDDGLIRSDITFSSVSSSPFGFKDRENKEKRAG